MKKCLVLFLLVFIWNCSLKKAPEFIGLNNIKLIDINNNTITLATDALFKNVNDVGGHIETDSIIVTIDNVKMARVQVTSFNVPARKEFTVPLKVNIPTKDVFNQNNLTHLFNRFLNQELHVNFKGTLNYKVLGFSRAYTINQTEKINIKL